MLRTTKGAVIGNPVNHSLSPLLFGILSKRLNRRFDYDKLELSTDALPSFLEKARCDNFSGINVTLPHKEKLIHLVDYLSPEAHAVGALNVVRFNKGVLEGYNTDVIGIRSTFKEQGVEVRNACVCLFGAGGAAKAVAYALGVEGAAKVFVINRSRERAQNFCRYFESVFPQTEFISLQALQEIEASAEPIVSLINATAVGLPSLSTEAFEFPSNCTTKTLAFDLIYGQKNAPFKEAALKRKIAFVDGLDMFVWQAIGSWEIWFGEVEGKNLLKDELKQELKQCCGI